MKIILCVIILFLLFILFWPTGDVNFNGRLNSADVHRVHTTRLNPVQFLIADVNHDFKVDQFDLDILFQMVLRKR